MQIGNMYGFVGDPALISIDMRRDITDCSEREIVTVSPSGARRTYRAEISGVSKIWVVTPREHMTEKGTWSCQGEVRGGAREGHSDYFFFVLKKPL